jgi:hypothetical protein
MENELAGAVEDYLAVGAFSEAAASMGSMLLPEDVASEEEKKVTGKPGQTQLPLSSLLGPQGDPHFWSQEDHQERSKILLHFRLQQSPSCEDLQDAPNMLPLMMLLLMMAQGIQR